MKIDARGPLARVPVRACLHVGLSLAVLARAGAAQEPDLASRVEALERRNAELEARVSALAEEQESLLLGGPIREPGPPMHGLGPSASKVYSTSDGLSLGGYGEALVQPSNGGPDEADFLRLVLYVGYRFDEHWAFNSEIEFEHGGEELGVEFATIDYLGCAALNVRAGLVLIPMGFVNEQHEPPTFLAATRPETERRILPSTWREIGLGVFGDAGPFSYRAYLVNGFDARGYTDEGLRGGRQNGSEALAEDVAVVGRLDWNAIPGLLVGASLYHGDAGQDQAGVGDTTTTIGDLHAEWRADGLWVRGLAARARVDDVAQLNTFLGRAGMDSVGEELAGHYLEVGYDVLPLLCGTSTQSLSPYLRYEAWDTQVEVPSGFASDPLNDERVLTLGLNWSPRPNLVFKAEYQEHDVARDGFALAVGFSF